VRGCNVLAHVEADRGILKSLMNAPRAHVACVLLNVVARAAAIDNRRARGLHAEDPAANEEYVRLLRRLLW